jgi:hypothetical protein
MAMRGSKNGFGKIVKMIDELVVNLGKEQEADNEKKAYCLSELDEAEDKKKGLDADISDLDKAIASSSSAIALSKSEMSASSPFFLSSALSSSSKQ